MAAAVASSLPPGEVVIALGGGADSAVAAWACRQVAGADRIRACHIDHGWPGSPALGRAAVSLAAHLGIALHVVTIDVPPGPSPEGAARLARLEALEAEAGEAAVVMGHQADDLAETVLGNLVRGAGTEGLGGITPSRGCFVRPLLGFTRADLRDLARFLELPFVDDPANEDRSARRNVLRHEIIPLLEARLNPQLRPALVRAAVSLQDDEAALQELADAVPIHRDGEAVLIPVAPLVTVSPAVASRVIRRALRMAHPPYPGRSREIGVVLAAATGRRRGGDLSGGFAAVREGPFVTIHQPARAAPVIDVTPLPVPGRVEGDGWVISSRYADVGAGPVSLGRRRCRLGADLAKADLAVRSARRGDRVDVGNGTKAVTTALAEAGIPLRKRLGWPLVVARGKIAWLAGVRSAAWAGFTPRDRTGVELTMERRGP